MLRIFLFFFVEYSLNFYNKVEPMIKIDMNIAFVNYVFWCMLIRYEIFSLNWNQWIKSK